jgi:hypothetical protein
MGGGELKVIAAILERPAVEKISIILGCKRECQRAHLPEGSANFKTFEPSG